MWFLLHWILFRSRSRRHSNRRYSRSRSRSYSRRRKSRSRSYSIEYQRRKSQSTSPASNRRHHTGSRVSAMRSWDIKVPKTIEGDTNESFCVCVYTYTFKVFLGRWAVCISLISEHMYELYRIFFICWSVCQSWRSWMLINFTYK